jgi:CO/xanthine dehydrogenase Mo-binding subunit
MTASADPRHEAPDGPQAAVFAEPERRVESQLKVTGRARYAADLHPPGTLWAGFLMSPLPHARIVSIDAAEARALPGVHAVVTGADVGSARFGRRLMDWPVLAWERVRFIGERVAAVAAETPEQVEQALGEIVVEYDELPAVFEPHEALAPGAPALHEQASEYVYLGGTRPDRPHPNLQGYVLVQKGEPDIERALAQADRVFEHTFTTDRVHQGHIEPHATLVWIETDGVVHVVSTNKGPFSLRTQMATALGLPTERIVIDSHFIGGDFGGKGLSIDEFACYELARVTGRPIKAVMSYVDELQAVNPRHAATIRLRTAVTREGRFLAHQAEIVFNGGAYAAGKPAPALIPAGGTATLAPYSVPNARIEVKTAYTNTVPGGHMRAPGEVQAVFAGESHVDMIARQLGIDPLELRLRNAVREGQSGPANERFREPRGAELLETLRRETEWGEKELPRNVGRGLALGVRHVGGGKTSVDFRLRSDGTIEAVSGVPDQGSGGHTVIQRVAAAVLSVDPELIAVRFGTTAESPLDPGAGGSRVTHIVGQAARAGAAVLKERLEELASEVMGWPSGSVHLRQNHFVLADGSDGATFEEVARRIAAGAPVEVRGDYDDGGHGHDEPGDYNFAAYAAEVEVDPETGRVTVRDVVLAVDVGTIINPVAHEGQLEGGFICGLGGALMEALPVEDGRVTVLSLGEYKLPNPMDAPALRTILLPTSVGPGPFGAKMAGEASNSGVAPAIANAVADAVGARVTTLPITAERVRDALCIPRAQARGG